MRPTPPPKADRIWDAYCYLTDAMAPAEVALFEDQLAHDQPARDALTEAIQLVDAVRLVAAEPAAFAPLLGHPKIRQPRRRWVLVATGSVSDQGPTPLESMPSRATR